MKVVLKDQWHIKLTFAATNDNTTFKIIDYQLKAIFYPEHFNATTRNNLAKQFPTIYFVQLSQV